MNISLAQVEGKYRRFREVVYRGTEEEEYAAFGVGLHSISVNDALDADEWPNAKSWSWVQQLRQYCNDPKRFDVGLSVKGRLCALCIGTPSKAGLSLKLHVLEGKPDGNPLKGQVLKIILFAAHGYAGMIGATEVWLCDPINDDLVSVYERYGYMAVRDKKNNVTHLKKDT